ncbi:polysaccharide pyruvyl transferase family protein [Halalkalicoccus sp. NIPERK01]|uniref:polysaccharide pyruvyl transferase family protein n=1 Tax=Halalkalicoccus sp. NIPERK01 TaxID=3053469 RepID=UPI00256F52A6|nr:polysaccharide pyruvyl transferase family protein [Halalkalicoccus sp. NIPERK01]MDL5360562.1 polysaccharide pyruvyl transferase family protein [Halalkalicoccus sp. NIPERK01]
MIATRPRTRIREEVTNHGANIYFPMSSINILITDYHCASNRGDAAILKGVIDGLRTEYPDATFTVATEYPKAAEAINGVDAIEQRTVPFKPYHVRKNPLLGLVTANALASRIFSDIPVSSQIASKLNLVPYLESDLIVATGGQYLTDNYMPSKIGAFWELLLCKLLGKPVVLYAQSIGPLKEQPYASIGRYVLDRIDLITVRDERSKSVLESLDVSETPIYVTADAAFSMNLDNSDGTPLQRRRIESIPSLESSGPLVSISAREWSYFGEEGGQNEYELSVAAFADWLLTEQDATVVFISTCTGFDGYHTDDRATANAIINRMGKATAEKPQILTGEYTPTELSEFYGSVDLHVGTRMHSNILALLQATPVIGIEYEFKMSELMYQFELEDYVVDIDHVTAPMLIGTVERAFEDIDSIESRIKSNLDRIRARSQRTANLVSECLDL